MVLNLTYATTSYIMCFMRGSFNGRTSAFQADNEGSIPLPRSNTQPRKFMTVKKQGLSRGSEIDIEKCVENSLNNRFFMILAASARAREVAKRQKEYNPETHVNSTVSALIEVEKGMVDPVTYLKKYR